VLSNAPHDLAHTMSNTLEKTVVLCSGGMDSVAALYESARAHDIAAGRKVYSQSSAHNNS
jgi:diphthamide synthase (EF-2-diphthine--ammonia ligase)